MTDRIDLDPFVEGFFDVEFGFAEANKARAFFLSISGGEMSITLIEHNVVYQNGGSSTLFIPGATSYAPLTLHQGVTNDMAFWKWWTDVTKGKKMRFSGTITAYGRLLSTDAGTDTLDSTQRAATMNVDESLKATDEFKKQAVWNLSNVWPLSISGFNFDLDSTDPFIAEITLVAEGIERTL